MTKNTRPIRRDAGFTLIELMVVIAVIGIIASISLIAMVTYREKAQAARVAQEVANFQKAVAVYYAENQAYPDPRTASNADAACVIEGSAPDGGTPAEKCCVSQGGCEYAGEPYDTLIPGTGDFASAPQAPRWLSYLGETAHAIFGGSMPSFLTEAPAVTGYKGVFYECANDACTNAYVYFSVPPTVESCTRGTAHGGGEFFGVCAQDITGGNVDGSTSGGETENCANGIDDDGDDLVDCSDDDCGSHPSCAATEDCSTSGDEDEDGFGQCDDSDCFGDATYCTDETSNGGTCGDGKNNDGLGEADCGDDECFGNTSHCTTETANSGSCSDSADNDGDGLTDGADTADCGSPTEDCSTAGDEDADGYGQCDDPDCFGNPTYCTDETTNGGTCFDGKNTDNDATTDCSDSECSDACSESGSECADTSDNDQDGYADCGDSECSGWSTSYSYSAENSCSYDRCYMGWMEVGASCASGSECYDGQDNDSDGCYDYNDTDCGGGGC